ncbi:MAG: hypothetical protein HPY76_07300 [Anaerolineae bacterium]|jgi:hypothetical protein|nr:hypothetical protein [Anaerolineae bacterium]
MDVNDKIKKAMTPWRNLIAAAWIIGIAILAWRGWWWPGILVLVGIHMVLEGIARQKARQAYEQMVLERTAAKPVTAASKPQPDASPKPGLPVVAAHAYASLPNTCPSCGAAVRGEEVAWRSERSAACAFCGANLPLKQD